MIKFFYNRLGLPLPLRKIHQLINISYEIEYYVFQLSPLWNELPLNAIPCIDYKN